MQAYIPQHLVNNYFRLPITISHGDGCFLYDDKGSKYLDYASGIAVNSLGHNHPKISHAIKEQCEKLLHVGNLFRNKTQEQFAASLCGASFADKIFFCSSGLEAVETAIKFMRKAQYENGFKSRRYIISFNGGFHGRSLACLAIGGNDYARRGFFPPQEGFLQIGKSNPQIDETLAKIGSENIAGFIIEPIQAEGGIYEVSPNLLQYLREICNQHKIFLCFDEVQCGMGRTGSLFHHQKIGITPDILTSAKSIGGGLPLAAVLMKENIASYIKPSQHGSTYGGNPLVMAVGQVVLGEILSDGFLQNIAEQGQYLKASLMEVKKQHPDIIKEIRGDGLLLGTELQENFSATEVMIKLIENGAITTKAGADKVLRITPPLIITRNLTDIFIEKLAKTLQILCE